MTQISPACNSHPMANSPPVSPPSEDQPAGETEPENAPSEATAPPTASKQHRTGRRKLGDRVKLYEALVAAYRKQPGATKVVAKMVGVARETAAKAWNHGYPASVGNPGLRAIKEVIAEERLAVRAMASDEAAKDFASVRARELLEEATRQSRLVVDQAKNESAAMLAAAEQQAKQRLADLLKKAKLDSAQSIADRAQMMNLGRKSTIAAVALPAIVMQNVQEIANMISKAIKEGSFKSPNQAIQAGLLLTRVAEASTRALHNHIMAENLSEGRPTDILEVQTESRSLEETEESLSVLQEAIQRKKLKLLNGGLTGENSGNGTLPH